MKYILDFDGVIFNTELLKNKFKQVQSHNVKISLTAKNNLTILQNITKTDNNFAIQDLVFADALDFLKKHQGNCFIVSSACSRNKTKNIDFNTQKEFQIAKIKLSGVWDLVDKVFITAETKTDILHKLQATYGAEMVFVDDTPKHIKDALSLGIKSVLMKRFSGEYDTNCAKTKHGNLDIENSAMIFVVSDFLEFSALKLF